MNFQEYANRHETGCLVLDEGFALCELDGRARDELPMYFDNVHSIIFIAEGELTAEIGGKPYRFSRNGFADVIDAIPFGITSVSRDLRAWHLLLTEDFLAGVIKNRPPFPFSYMLEMRERPVATVDDETMSVYLHRMKEIARVMSNTHHHFRAEMVRNAVWMFLLDVADAYMRHCESERSGDDSGRMKMLFARFMYMLPQHVREGHTVGFFASKLCITPQYLNRIVRRISGGSASETINRLLVGEIVKLLKDSDMSMQEIADALNFADQATMTKFFRRHKGCSPTEYRKANR